jgi:putative transcriptional regulator
MKNIKKVANSLAKKIKELRASKGWTQEDLSKRSGINRVTLASIETNKIKNPSTEIFLKLARAFGIVPEELYMAAGYITDYKSPYDHKFTLEEILDLARAFVPIAIPVYNLNLFARCGMDISVQIEPLGHMLRPRSATVIGKNIGFLVDRDFMSPMISVNDSVIFDSNADINSGDIVACVIDGQSQIGKLQKTSGKLVLENNFGRFPLNPQINLARVIVATKNL